MIGKNISNGWKNLNPARPIPDTARPADCTFPDLCLRILTQ